MTDILKVLLREVRHVRVVKLKYWRSKEGWYHVDLVTEAFGVAFNTHFVYDGETISINDGSIVLSKVIEQMWHDIMSKLENWGEPKSPRPTSDEVAETDVQTSHEEEEDEGSYGVVYDSGLLPDDPTLWAVKCAVCHEKFSSLHFAEEHFFAKHPDVPFLSVQARSFDVESTVERVTRVDAYLQQEFE